MSRTNTGLSWPSELDRTPPEEREANSRYDTDFQKTKRELRKEMEMMNVERWKLDDVTGTSGDPGVVLRWDEDDVPHAVACDHYEKKRDNIRAVYLWINETRMRAQRNVVTGDTDFAAARLMPPGEDVEPQRPPPHEVLDIRPDAPDHIVEAAARAAKGKAHPDQGGSLEEKELVEWAEEEMLGDG